MANYSLGEIDSLARKATRGAGYSWGIAEEVGKAVRWLSAYGFLGAEALAEYLTLVADKQQDFVPKLKTTTSAEITFDNANSSLCSLYCGTLINDLGYQVEANKALSFADMLFPLLALPSAGRIAEAYSMSVSLAYDQTTIICDPKGILIKGIVINDTPPLTATFFIAKKADVVCSRVKNSLENTHFPSPQSRAIAQDALDTLLKFAHKTYAPATAESRLRGAG